MTWKGCACLCACGWSPKLNLRLQKAAEVLKTGISAMNTTSKQSKNCKNSKSSHSNCGAMCYFYSWMHVRNLLKSSAFRNTLFSPLFFPHRKLGWLWRLPFHILFCHILVLPHWCQQDTFLMALTALILCAKTPPTLYSILPTQRRESQVLPPVSQPCQTLQRCFHHITHTTQTPVKQFKLSQWN